MTKISVITPFHKPIEKYLLESYECLKQQTYTNWQWILIPNAGGQVPDEIKKDKRVRIVETIEDKLADHNKIGRLKNIASFSSEGDIIVEYDGDDILLPEALEKIEKVFKDNNDVVFVYSNSAEFKDETWESDYYKEYWGWEHLEFEYKGHKLYEMVAWPPSPQMMRYIFWAPNHVRAWRKNAYIELGGHDITLAIGDDHDLCCRFYTAYGAKGFHHINECLYLYRIHDQSSVKLYNSSIQEQTGINYRKYSRDMATKWAKDEKLLLLDLGGRIGDKWMDYKSVDILEPADYVCDLNKKWPFKDNSVGVIKASHIFEHLKNPIHTMNEAYRVLAPGGWLFIEVPSTDGRGAYQDPTHISFWNENSMWYYTDKNYSRYIPAFKGRFQRSRIVTYYPTEFEKTHDIPIVQADLIALKLPYSNRPVGEISI